MKAFLVSLAIFISLMAALALGAFLFLVDTSPMGRFEYLYETGKLIVFRYTGVGSLSDREIKLVYEGRCTRKCHSRDVVERSAHTAREWEDIIGRMKGVNKASISGSEAGVILSYLAKRHGSNIPTILTAEGGKYLKQFLWRSDFGESDLYVDIIYTPSEYFNLIGGNSEVEGYSAEKHTLFKVYINTHQNKLTPFALDRLATLKAGDSEQAPVLWKVIYDSADYHHREGVLVFRKVEDSSASMTLTLEDLPGQKERVFLWELPIPEKP